MGAQHQVVMVAHQAERQYHRLKPLRGAGQHLQQPHPIIIIREDRLAAITSAGHVIRGAGELDA